MHDRSQQNFRQHIVKCPQVTLHQEVKGASWTQFNASLAVALLSTFPLLYQVRVLHVTCCRGWTCMTSTGTVALKDSCVGS